MKKEISLSQDDELHVYFEGHEYIVKYDVRTNESLIMEKVM